MSNRSAEITAAYDAATPGLGAGHALEAKRWDTKANEQDNKQHWNSAENIDIDCCKNSKRGNCRGARCAH